MILVTGGTGFLGAYIIKNLVGKGESVRALRRSPRLPFFLPEQIGQQVEWVEGDVLDTVSLADALKGARGLVHAAAVVSFDRSDRRRMYQVNVEGTANVVNAALDAGTARFLYVSSVAALGRTTTEETVNEEKKWVEHKSNTHYAISKQKAEMEVWRGFAEGLEGAVINPSTILGFGDWNQSSCAIFKNVYRGFPWYTEGINGFVGVEDVAEAAARLLLSEVNQQKFIVNAENLPFRDLFNLIADGFQKKRPHRRASPALGELAWRMEKLRSAISGRRPLLTRETAKIAHSKTSFDRSKLTQALPAFCYTALSDVVSASCAQYLEALKSGTLTA